MLIKTGDKGGRQGDETRGRKRDKGTGVLTPDTRNSVPSSHGLTIYMYFFDMQKHKLPHIHVFYAEKDVVVSIPDGDVLEGEIPNKKLHLIKAWITIHEEELMANWQLAISGESLYKIDPLK